MSEKGQYGAARERKRQAADPDRGLARSAAVTCAGHEEAVGSGRGVRTLTGQRLVQRAVDSAAERLKATGIYGHGAHSQGKVTPFSAGVLLRRNECLQFVLCEKCVLNKES